MRPEPLQHVLPTIGRGGGAIARAVIGGKTVGRAWINDELAVLARRLERCGKGLDLTLGNAGIGPP
jgi:hypothetical protein